MRIALALAAATTVCLWTIPAAGQQYRDGGAVPPPPSSPGAGARILPPDFGRGNEVEPAGPARASVPASNDDAVNAPATSAYEPRVASRPLAAPAAAAPTAAFTLATPRSSLMTFFAASAAGDFATASQAMDFTTLESGRQEIDRAEYARRLKALFDRQGSIDLQTIPDQPQGGAVAIHVIDGQQPMTLDRGEDGQWRFTAAGVSRIEQLEALLAELPEEVAEEKATLESKLLSLPLVHEVLGTPLPFVNNSLYRIITFVLTLLISLMIGRFIRYMFTRAAERLERRGRQFTPTVLRSLAKAAVAAMLTLGFSIGANAIVLPASMDSLRGTVISSLNVFALGYVAWSLVDVVNYWLAALSAKTNGKLDDMLVPLASKSLRGIIATMTLVQVVTIVSDKPVTSVIAGLGIGGLAIGLAAQDAIKNLFGSVMIFTDRPFETGDRIVVDGHDGPVELVGFRSTRIRTGDGHMVTIPNGELANKTILNIGKPPFLKRSMTVKLEAKTSPDQVERAVSILKDILKDHDGFNARRPPGVHFAEIAENSLNVAVSYSYSPPDGAKFAQLNERVNFEILKRFKAAGLQLASPTQVLELAEKVSTPQVLPMLKSHAA